MLIKIGTQLTLAGLLLLVRATAAQPQLSLVQLTSNPNCNGGSGANYPAIDAKAERVVFTSTCDLVPGGNADQNSEVFVMNVDGTGLKQLTFSTGGLGSFNTGMSSSGEKIVFASDRDLLPGNNADLNSEIFFINADGSGLAQLTHTTGGDPNNFGGSSHPRIDPSGLKVTFSSDRDLVPGSNPDGNHELFVINVNGTGVKQLTSTTGGYGVFAPGNLNSGEGRVVFDSDRDLVPGSNTDGNSEIFLMNVNGSGLVQLTHTVGGNGCIGPVWSSNGQTVAFWSDRDLTGNNADADYEVFRMNIDGTHVVQVTAGTGGFGSAPWGISADGKTMAVESDRDLVPGSNTALNFEIYLVTLRP